MVEIIGIVTLVGLSWVLAFSMANECEAEKRKRAAAAFHLAETEDQGSWKVLSPKHAA